MTSRRTFIKRSLGALLGVVGAFYGVRDLEWGESPLRGIPNRRLLVVPVLRPMKATWQGENEPMLECVPHCDQVAVAYADDSEAVRLAKIRAVFPQRTRLEWSHSGDGCNRKSTG